MVDSSRTQIAHTYEMIENGYISQAKEELGELYSYNFENHELKFAIWCCTFWIRKFRALEKSDPYEKSERIITNWKEFCAELKKKYDSIFEQTIYSFRKGIFSIALEGYLAQTSEKDPIQRAEILRKAGLCYKKLGNYEKALFFLDEANQLTPGNAPIVAERGDCMAFVGDEQIARLLLNEAFFIDASKIDLDFLDSELIQDLINRVRDLGYTGVALQEWIPVYGKIYGVFNTKRQLKSREIGRLKQEIYTLENELKDPQTPKAIVLPRLLNLYFWLIDYYVSIDAEKLVNKIFVKIKLQDENIYRLYIK